MVSCCNNEMLNNIIYDIYMAYVMHPFFYYCTSLIRLMGKKDRCSPALLWGRNCTRPCWACRPPPGSLHTCGSWTGACDTQTDPDKCTCKHGPLMTLRPTSCSSSEKLNDCQSLFHMHLHTQVLRLHFNIPTTTPHIQYRLSDIEI